MGIKKRQVILKQAKMREVKVRGAGGITKTKLVPVKIQKTFNYYFNKARSRGIPTKNIYSVLRKLNIPKKKRLKLYEVEARHQFNVINKKKIFDKDVNERTFVEQTVKTCLERERQESLLEQKRKKNKELIDTVLEGIDLE